MGKKALCLIFAFLLSIESFAAVVSDNDGSAFITKAEFDSLKNDFQSQLDSYNSNIDAKIDAAIASYLAGVTMGTKVTLNNNYEKILNSKSIRWVSGDTWVLTNKVGYGMRFMEHKEVYPNGKVTWTGTISKALRKNVDDRWTFENIYVCTRKQSEPNKVYVTSEQELEPLFSEWNFYKFGVFGGYTSNADANMQLAGRTPEPRWDRVSLKKTMSENEYRDNGDLNRNSSYIPSYQFNSGSHRMIYNVISYTCEKKKEYDYLIMAPISTSNTYYYWSDCEAYISHGGWENYNYIPASGANYTYTLDNDTWTYSASTNGVNYTYRQIVFKPTSQWTNYIATMKLTDNVPWINCSIRQNRLRYKTIIDATGDDNEINYGILLTNATDDGKITFKASAAYPGTLVIYAGSSMVSNMGTSTATGISRFSIATSSTNVSFEVKKGDKIRFVYLPTNTTAQSTFTIDTDIVLEKTE